MRRLLRKFDAWISLKSGIFEFTTQPGCLLRLQITSASRLLRLLDLTVAPGEPVVMLHLWNERLPAFSSNGVDLAWARRFLSDFTVSLHLVASYLEENPALQDVRAIGGVTILLTSGARQAGSRFIQHLGFTILPYHGRLGRFGEFWENFYSWLIIWTFNPAGLPERSLLNLRRSEMWMSREQFLRRHGGKTLNVEG